MDILILVALIALNGVFALSELAIVSARKTRLQARADKGDRGARAALKLHDDPSRFLSTVQIGITLVGILAGAYGATEIARDFQPFVAKALPGLAQYSGLIAFGLVIVLTTYLSLILGELVPKRIAMTAPETFAALAARPMQLLSAAAFPLVWLLRGSTNFVLSALGLSRLRADEVTEEEIQSVIEEGVDSGAIDAEERTMIRSVMRLADRDVRSIMTPRNEVIWLDLEDSQEESLKRIRESGHSRFPIAKGDLSQVSGIVQAKDLLVRGGRLDLEAAAHEPLFVPDTVNVVKLLEMMRESPVRMALVVDELGDVEGIVTSADILGAIAGASAFSPEDGPDAPKQREDGSWLIDGRMAIDDIEIMLGASGLGSPDVDATTIAGLLIHHLQRLPQLGDKVTAGGWRIEVMDMDGRRVDKVLLSRVPGRELDPSG